MKNTIIYIILSVICVSCFKDEGNYEYLESKAPVFDVSYALGYGGGDLTATADYYYPQADSIELEQNSKCEWVLNDVVLAEGKELSIPVEDALEMADMEYGNHYGMFRVTNTQTGIAYIQQVVYYIRPKYWKGGWLILSKDGTDSKLSYQRPFYTERDSEGNVIWEYENYDNIFSQQNDGKTIPGEPIQVIDHYGTHINSFVGATTLLTKEVAWDLNNEDFTIAADLSEEFSSEKPDYSYIKDIGYIRYRFAVMLDNNGKVYTRTMSENYLGGKFLSEPVSFDEKESTIDFISRTKLGAYVNYMYDSKNKRLIAIDRNDAINPIEKTEGDHLVDVTNFGDDKQVLYMANNLETPLGYVSFLYSLGVILYKQEEKLYAYEFVGNAYLSTTATNDKSINYELPFNVGDDDLLWIPHYKVSAMPDKYQYAICYTNGDEFRMYDREKEDDKLIFKCDHKITALKFYGYYSTPKFYNWIGVGLENGDFFVMNTEEEPAVMVEGTKFNVGGQIVSITQVGGQNNN